MKNSILLFITVFFSICISAQVNRHLLEVSGSGGISPGFFANSFGSEMSIYTNGGVSTLEQRNIKYNGLLNAEYTFLASKRFGIGVRVSYKQMRIPIEQSITYEWGGYSDYYDYNEFKRESPSFSSVSALFVMKFTPRNSILPFGLEHTIGFGPRFYSMVNKPYYGSYSDTSGTFQRGTIPQNVNTELNNQNYKGVEILYGLALNFPVGNSHFISFGFDFHASFLLKNSYKALEVPTYDPDKPEEVIERLYYNRSYADELSRRALLSIVTFKIGYKISF